MDDVIAVQHRQLQVQLGLLDIMSARGDIYAEKGSSGYGAIEPAQAAQREQSAGGRDKKKLRGRHPVRKVALFVLISAAWFLSLWIGLSKPTRLPFSGNNPDSPDGQKQAGAYPTWAEITPTTSLEWHKCYDGAFDCARLNVPMDWLDPSDDERVVLAVIRYKAKSTENYLGPVFVNPGGPGGSGVEFVRSKAEELQTIVGDNHDILSFDPRGVGASIPRIDCWSSSIKRTLWASSQISVVDSHPGMIYDFHANSLAWSSACESAMSGSNLLRHVATASHARDMLAILDATGRPRLRYWGFSYGTILGGAFAALFPDRVERLVSDGNVDYGEWYAAAQRHFLQDADKIIDAFGASCHAAGRAVCAFWAASPAAVEARLDALLAKLRMRPVLIPADAEEGPEMPTLVTYADVRRLISFSFYKPFQKFPALARVFAALEEGDGRPYLAMVTDFGPAPGPVAFCSLNETSPLVPEDVAYPEAFPAIMCADGEKVEDGPEEMREYAEGIIRLSRATGAANTHFRGYCVGREVRPKYRFAGPFNGTITSYPILFIGNIGDNVTPLASAHNNSANFDGSVVLTQKSYGHCSISTPSTCTAKIVNAYFQTGQLPSAGTFCDPDFDLFQEPTSSASVHAAEDRPLAAAMQRLAEKVDWTGPW